MKKLLIVLLCAGIASGIHAQDSTKKAGMKDLRKDIRDVKKDKTARAADLKAGDKTAAAAETQDIKSDKKDIASDAKSLKAQGVKHPVKRAERQIKKHG
jgi:hypothetical protein